MTRATQFYTYTLGDELEVDVGYHVSSYGCAAQTIGPPERCYPAESAEVELVSAVIRAKGQPDMDILPYLPASMTDEISSLCCEDAAEQEQAAREAAAESKWEAEREDAL
ncbi:hypothetical protein UFOVP154_64 [uncultured Caudovirales phage]|uniref:Uncharacterized protein n=1 Tax=uncultured Caudovirales phage TaxID=2100421 RepID=A0A6J7WEA0_9CAUD|nr:hypothetical protein UFOVP8_49 [uncultured Caudovirales phage]CAB5171029.1 hypothetical protein UFOVP154_64 [uncultured Caudovirales phage]